MLPLTYRFRGNLKRYTEMKTLPLSALQLSPKQEQRPKHKCWTSWLSNGKKKYFKTGKVSPRRPIVIHSTPIVKKSIVIQKSFKPSIPRPFMSNLKIVGPNVSDTKVKIVNTNERLSSIKGPIALRNKGFVSANNENQNRRLIIGRLTDGQILTKAKGTVVKVQNVTNKAGNND